MDHIRFILAMGLVGICLTGCAPIGGNGGSDQGADPSGDPGQDAGGGQSVPDGDAESFTLSLTLRSLEAGSTLKRVWAAVDEQPYTRQTFPYGSAVARNIVTTENTLETTLSAMSGQWITLIAFDSQKTFASGVSRFTDIENIDFPGANEFVRWDGPFATADVGGLGELSYRVDDDRSITAVYRRMPTFVVRSQVNGQPLTGPGILATLETSDFLSFPEESGPSVEQFGFSIGYMGVQLIGAARTDSILAMSPNDEQGDSRLVFIQWLGDCSGGATCVLTAGQGSEAISDWMRTEF